MEELTNQNCWKYSKKFLPKTHTKELILLILPLLQLIHILIMCKDQKLQLLLIKLQQPLLILIIEEFVNRDYVYELSKFIYYLNFYEYKHFKKYMWWNN